MRELEPYEKRMLAELQEPIRVKIRTKEEPVKTETGVVMKCRWVDPERPPKITDHK